MPKLPYTSYIQGFNPIDIIRKQIRCNSIQGIVFRKAPKKEANEHYEKNNVFTVMSFQIIKRQQRKVLPKDRKRTFSSKNIPATLSEKKI